MTEHDLRSTTDAMVWAKEFVATCRKYRDANPYDEGFMVGWFANAIEAGRDAGAKPASDEDHDECRECGYGEYHDDDLCDFCAEVFNSTCTHMVKDLCAECADDETLAPTKPAFDEEDR